MKAMILAAGFGTRLWPLTEDRTKPAIPFLNRPLITYAVEYLTSFDIKDIIINLHHEPETIERTLGDGSSFGANITYSHEEEILGTSGAIDRVRDKLSDGDFVLMNGKVITDISLDAVVAQHKERNSIATLVLKANIARDRFSVVEIDSRNRICRFSGYPQPEESSDDPPLMFTGIQILSPRIFEYVPRSCFSHSTTDVYPRAIQAGEDVAAYVGNGNWYEFSTLKRYIEISLEFMQQRGSPMVTGKGCKVSVGADVRESILWNDVTVETGAKVEQSVLADGVRIPAGSYIRRSVVVRREIVREVQRGEIAGENLIVPVD